MGKASDERSALQVLDRLKATRALSDVKLVYWREAEGGTREVAFGMNFIYIGTE